MNAINMWRWGVILTVISLLPTAFAADKNASAEFGPEAGALIALREYVEHAFIFFLRDSQKNTHPTIPLGHICVDLQ